MIRRDLSTKENRKFWSGVKKTARKAPKLRYTLNSNIERLNKNIDEYMDGYHAVYVDEPYQFIKELKDSNRDFFISRRQSMRVVLDYPLSGTFEFKFNRYKGFRSSDIIDIISKAYHKVYSDESKYGVWGHSILDLVIGKIIIKGDKIMPDIGS